MAVSHLGSGRSDRARRGPVTPGALQPTPGQLDALFAARVRQAVGAGLAEVRGTVLFRVDHLHEWTVVVDRGNVGLRRGAPARPTSTIHTDAATMAAILEGSCSGMDAFLDGSLTARGSLALALQVDGAFDVGQVPDRFPHYRFVDAAGVHTAYLEAGPRDAPPVFLLHGLGATNASLLPLVAQLATDHHVIAPDNPGFGASAAPRWRYTAADFARWLAALMERLQTGPATLVGNSLGGRIAIEMGLTRPDLTTRIVGLCPSPAFMRLRQMVPAVRLIPPELARLPMVMSHRLVCQSLRLMFANPNRLPAPWYDAAADEFRRVMKDSAHRYACFATMREIYLEEPYGEHGFWDRLRQLTVPSLFVWGERDRLVPAGFARHVVDAVPSSHSVVIPDCGHVPQYEWPERTGALVRRFLAGGPVG